MEVIDVLNTVAVVAIVFVGYKIFKLQQEITACMCELDDLRIIEAEMDAAYKKGYDKCHNDAMKYLIKEGK
jgi:hypothetical protein